MKTKPLAAAALVLLCVGPVTAPAGEAPPAAPPAPRGADIGGVFARDNLVAWCIVPFDAQQRGPKERAAMLVRLGVRRVAYDWRDHHVPQWDEELEQYKRHGIELIAFWAPNRHKEILELLKRHNVKAQLWVMGAEPAGETQAQRVEASAADIAPVAKLASEYGCTVGLYNHGGWFGQPENQVAIIDRLNADGVNNVGMVYNLHHGHEHVERFPGLMKLMKPHLMCLTVNGMKRGGPKILPVGQGDNDRAILEAIRDSGYAGPVAVLNHREEVDAEVGLRQNVEGLKKLLEEMKDEAALRTYAE